MTILSSPILAQIDIGALISGVNAQFGALASLFALICILLFNIYRNQENAKTERRKAETEQVRAKTEREKEDIRQEAIINDIVERAGKLEQELRDTVKAQFTAEGRATAYEKQIQYLQEKFDNREKDWTRDYRKLKSAYIRIDKRLKELGEDLKKEKEENLKLNEALTNALQREKRILSQLEDSEKLRTNHEAEWRKEKYALEEQVHGLHSSISHLNERLSHYDSPESRTPTMQIASELLNELNKDIEESNKEFSQQSTEHEKETPNETP